MLKEKDKTHRDQDLTIEREFYEKMFSGLTGPDDGHCIVYGQERLYDFMDDVERGTLLEAGCGGGHHGVNLSRRGFDVTSVDLTLSGVRAAKKLAEQEHQRIRYACSDIKHLPFEDKQFDICFCSLILHHFVSLDNLIKELTRVTRTYFVAFEVNALDPISFVRFNLINPTFGIANISKNQRALFPGRLKTLLHQDGFTEFHLKYDDMHEYLGRAPESTKARLILAYQQLMRILPERYSSNKFLLRARRSEFAA